MKVKMFLFLQASNKGHCRPSAMQWSSTVLQFLHLIKSIFLKPIFVPTMKINREQPTTDLSRFRTVLHRAASNAGEKSGFHLCLPKLCQIVEDL